MNVAIQRANVGDEQLLSLVGSATFLESFAGVLPASDIRLHCERQHSLELYRRWLEDGHSAVWLATVEPGRAPIGYAVVCKPDLPISDLGEGDFELKRIYLFNRFQGLGVGRRLVEAALALMRERGGERLLLGVYAKNEAALAFYARMGFAIVGERSFLVGENRYYDLVLSRSVTSL